MLNLQLQLLGSTLRRLRLQRGLDLDALAGMVGVTVPDLENLEGGRLDPPYSLFVPICDALRVDVPYLFGGNRYLPFDSEPVEGGIELLFQHGGFDARYFLNGATQEELDRVLRNLREGLAADQGPTAAVVNCFFLAVELWPDANPSDLWLFLLDRAYCDHANHPPGRAPGDISQSWKRTGGYALEAILRTHYGAFLAERGISVRKRTRREDTALLRGAINDPRLIPAKADVVVTRVQVGGGGEELMGVVHVKTSIAERRTDDIPLSDRLLENGYLAVFWTFDCKSFPDEAPVNLGEYGSVNEGEVNDKRGDVEQHGYFSACFSYNQNTVETASEDAVSRIHVCNFTNPDDAFSRFLLERA